MNAQRESIMSLRNPITLPKLKITQGELAYSIKLLVYRYAPNVIENLDLDNDAIFLDPLLFAYFNNMDVEDRRFLPSLEQLLYGYISPELRPERVAVVFDQTGVTYLSNIGYFKSDKKFAGKTAWLTQEEGVYVIQNEKGEKIETKYFPPLYLHDFEVFRFNNPLTFGFFSHLSEDGPVAYESLEVFDITQQKLEMLDAVIDMLKTVFPNFYEQVKCTNFRLMMFNYSPINSFVIKSFHGTIFMNTNPRSGKAFFVDDLVHQWSHNILNSFISDIPTYFKMDVEREIMSTYTGQAHDDRDIYGAFHGLFTVTQRVICFRELYKRNLLEGEDRKELIARYCDQNRRFKSGIETLDQDMVYTAKGKKLYKFLEQSTEDSLNEIAHILKWVSFKNQESRFSYDKFVAINDMSAL